MLNVKESRIGNLIIADDGCVAKINGFTPFDHSIRCDEAEGCVLLIDIYHELTGKWKLGREADSPECNPIPLTPEWLERFGFITKIKGDDFHDKALWKHPSTDYLYCESGCFVDNSGYYGDYCDIGDIKHVHQLQNLYFALTGEELAITQPVL